MRPLATLLVLVGALLAGNAEAQSPPTLRVGDRVRVTTIDNASFVGRIAHADDSRLTLVITEPTRMAPAVEQTVDRQTLAMIERSEGYGKKIRNGALIGGSLGLLSGLVVGYLAAFGAENNGPLYTVPIAFTAMGVLGGAAIGAGGGEQWTMLPFDTQVGLQFGARSIPLAIGLRASF